MKLSVNVFLLTEMGLEMTAESMCCWRVSPNGATLLELQRKGKWALHLIFRHLIQNLRFGAGPWVINHFLILFRFTQYQRMLGTLSQCEFSMGKTLMVYDMNLREMENYEKIYTNIGTKRRFLFFYSDCEPLFIQPVSSKLVHMVTLPNVFCVHIAEQSIMSAHEKIAECKKEIQRAKRIRKNRQGKNMFRMLNTYI